MKPQVNAHDFLFPAFLLGFSEVTAVARTRDSAGRRR